MGYRFSLESANTIANLTFGKVISCYRDIYSSEENFESFMSFLEQFRENMYSSENERYMRSIREILEIFEESRHMGYLNNGNMYYEYTTPRLGRYDFDYLINEKILDALYELSHIFSRCKIKSLLLPKMGETGSNEDLDEFMLSFNTLQHLLNLHPGDSCLILQPQERPTSAIIFDAFPNFEVALRQADLWPAVMFWDDNDDYAFIPVRNKDELYDLFKIVKYERHPISEIKLYTESHRKPCHYIFHLSDLHFGAKNIYSSTRRLKSLVESQLSKIEIGDNVDFVITGDIVDSPNNITEDEYRNFSEFLTEHTGTEPVCVLGNHDINNHGLAFFRKHQQLAYSIGKYPKIEILEDSKVILLLFDSNTNGNLAQGMIGTGQMAEMGNHLDKIRRLNDYLLIAVLHHHVLPIPEPDFYAKKWYKKFIPSKMAEDTLKLIDADLFVDWLIQRKVKFVLHGHKHIPFIAEEKGIHVISCGSSTGKITHKDPGKTYISYNLIKISDNAVTCTQFVEDVLGAGEKNIKTETIPLCS